MGPGCRWIDAERLFEYRVEVSKSTYCSHGNASTGWKSRVELRKKSLKCRFVCEKVKERPTQEYGRSPRPCNLSEDAHISAHSIIAYTSYYKNFEI